MNKQQKIIEFFEQNPDGSRQDAAEYAGSCVARVGEVIRAGLTGGPVIERKARTSKIQHADNEKEARKLTKETGKPTTFPLETRTGRCEHEKKRKTKTGSCKVCPPLEAS